MSAEERPGHDWVEDVGHCVSCWGKCVRCRKCKCQAKTASRRLTGDHCEVIE